MQIDTVGVGVVEQHGMDKERPIHQKHCFNDKRIPGGGGVRH